MVTATISRGTTSVTFDLVEEAGALIIAEDTGKPALNVDESPRGDPRIGDHYSALTTLTVPGRLSGSTAYDDARVLAEELIKPNSDGTALSLDLSNVSGFGTNDVAPTNERALELTYRSGFTNEVLLQLSLPVVNETNSGASGTTVSSSSGSGLGNSIDVTRDTTTVNLKPGLEVSRRVSRPGGSLQPQSGDNLVVYTDKQTSAADEFEISARLTSTSDETDLHDTIVRPRLGKDSITLDFGGTWNLGSYDVAPVGTGALRTSRIAGRTSNDIRLDGLTLRTMTPET